MSERDNAYRELQQHLDRMPVGYPATKTGVEISLLKSIFTPEQAKIAVHLDYKHKNIDQIYDTARGDVSSKEDLKRILDETVSNGGIFRKKRDGLDLYALMPFLLWGMYEHQLKRMDQRFLEDCGEYIMGEFGLEFATGRLPKMRVIPIEESIEAEHQVATYDELRQLIDQSGEHIAVQECFCRKAADMRDKPCQTTDRREVCMSFGDLADLYVEEGWARKIDQSEAMEMARLNEQEGLVLMPGNQQEPNFMCACCPDCCGMLSLIQNHPKPAGVIASNFYAEVNPDQCTSVGTCQEICPISAVVIENGFASIKLARCIGCGLCVPACPEHAISLVKKEQEVIPPVTPEDLFDSELALKNTWTGRARNHTLKTILRTLNRVTS